MRDIKTIVEEYQTGDSEERLNLFLEYPPLRDEFIQMEQGEAPAQGVRASHTDINQNHKTKSGFYPCSRLLKWCHSFGRLN